MSRRNQVERVSRSRAIQIPRGIPVFRNPVWMLPAATSLITGGFVAMDGAYHRPFWILAIVCWILGAALWLGLFQRVHSSWRVAVLRTVLLGFTIGFAVLASLEYFDRIEVRSGGSHIAANTSSILLQMVGVESTADAGHLRFEHPNGIVDMKISMEKLGLRFAWTATVVGLCSMLMLGSGLSRWIAVWTIAIFVLVQLRVLGLVGCMFLSKDPFSYSIESGFLSISSSFLFSLVLGLLTGLMPCIPSLTKPSGKPEFNAARNVVIVAATLFVSVVGSYLFTRQVPNQIKQGRVLVCDRHSGIWEPSQRILDKAWFGDFSTYSFSSLVEGLGRSLCMSTSNAEITQSTLVDTDILLLKTPERDYSSNELSVIDAWINEGGVAVLVGDHTDLMGMNSRLNQISRKYGIALMADSVNCKDGGFSVSRQPMFVGHPIELRSPAVTMMTSCSIALSGSAEPVLISKNCRVEGHDYANPSYFGSRRYYPEHRQGLVALAASAKAGKGMILAFSDSTTLSSFAIFLEGRFEFFSSLMAHASTLGTTRLLGTSAFSCLLILTGILASFSGGIAGYVRSYITASLLFIPCALYSANWITTQTLSQIHAPFDRQPKIAFVWEKSICAFPPVLGDNGKIPADVAFDTLLISMQRMGYIPEIVWKMKDLCKQKQSANEHWDAIFLISPAQKMTESELGFLVEYVERGGRLVVLDSLERNLTAEPTELCKKFQLVLDRHHCQTECGKNSPHIHCPSGVTDHLPNRQPVLTTHRGNGIFAYTPSAESYSRKGLGHCFAIPGSSQRSNYESIFYLFSDIMKMSNVERRWHSLQEKPSTYSSLGVPGS